MNIYKLMDKNYIYSSLMVVIYWIDLFILLQY